MKVKAPGHGSWQLSYGENGKPFRSLQIKVGLERRGVAFPYEIYVIPRYPNRLLNGWLSIGW